MSALKQKNIIFETVRIRVKIAFILKVHLVCANYYVALNK